MNLIGYFPGIDFTSEGQFGRKVHVNELIEKSDDIDCLSAEFVIGNAPSGYFSSNHKITLLGNNTTFIQKSLLDQYMSIYLIKRVYKDDIDVIYTRDSPYLAPLVANVVTNVPLVVEANGVPGEEDVGSKVKVLEDMVYNKIRSWKRKRSEKMITVAESVDQHIKRVNPLCETTVVQNGVDIQNFNIETKPTIKKPYKICYVGGLQEWQGIEKIMRVVEHVDNEVRLTVVGGSKARQKELSEFALSRGVRNIVNIVGRVPHTDVPEYVNNSDICFGPFNRSRKASPLKIYEYVACGREVILANNDGLEDLDSIPGVHRLSYKSDEELATEISSILDNLSTNKEGRNYIEQNHSWETVVNKILNECQSSI